MRLKSAELENEFQDIGAVLVPNFLSKSALSRVRGLYDELGLTDLKGIYSNVNNKSSEFNKKVDVIFQEIYKDSIEKHFENHQVGGGAFLIKGTGNESHSSLHQDWNIVDERKFQSAAIFCPIVDVDEQNGCLQILKGSHKWFQNIRSFHTPTPFFNFNQVEKGLVAFPAKAGDAVIFRHNVIHGSKPNMTSNIRVAAMVSVASKLATYVHYMKDGEEFRVLKADNDFYNTELSKLYSSENINVEEVDRISIEPGMVLDFTDFDKKYKKEFPDSFFSRVGKLFKNDK
tara:strand:+ start:1289 stop:2149 length:861 start_codon:yes stop_codon:yes gene_type:complete